MAKHGAVDGVRNGRTRDHSPAGGAWAKRAGNSRLSEITGDSGSMKGVRRDILFPSEPSAIGHKKIDRAIEQVRSRKKK
jgi:hypothetical protein